MKKAIIWFIAGFIAATAFSANAEVLNMIGKQVEGVFDLTINNQKMEYPAVMIDGTTYAPVRMLGEATGHIVRFDSETGVKLVKKITATPETVNRSINAVKTALTTNERMLLGQQDELTKLRQDAQTDNIISRIKSGEVELERLEKSNANLKNQISLLNQTLADIDAQEAELQK